MIDVKTYKTARSIMCKPRSGRDKMLGLQERIACIALLLSEFNFCKPFPRIVGFVIDYLNCCGGLPLWGGSPSLLYMFSS